MSTSSSTTFGIWRAAISGVIIGTALVAVVAVGAYIPAPSSAGPGGDAETPIYDSASTQNTTNFGVKRDTGSLYQFAVDGQSNVTQTLISQQNAIFDSMVEQSIIGGVPASTLDIQGNLYATGPITSPGNILNVRLSEMNPDYAALAIGSSEQVCATQAGVLVRCTGCMNPGADNFDPAASVDDGSCGAVAPPIAGCTDSAFPNYNPAATVDDGSCFIPTSGVISFFYERTFDLATFNDENPGLAVAGWNNLVAGTPAEWDRKYSVDVGYGVGFGISTFTVPPGVTSIDIQAWGAGGGGGSSDPRVLESGLGGGGTSGSYIAINSIAVTPGEVFQVSVPEGGQAGYYSCPPSANDFPNLDTNNNGTIELAELVGTPQSWTPIPSCNVADVISVPAESPSPTTITRLADGARIRVFSGRGGSNANGCSGGSGASIASTPTSALGSGTIGSSSVGLAAVTGKSCTSPNLTSTTVTSPGLCLNYNPGLTQGNPDANRYCQGGSSANRGFIPAYSFGNPGLVRIAW